MKFLVEAKGILKFLDLSFHLFLFFIKLLLQSLFLLLHFTQSFLYWGGIDAKALCLSFDLGLLRHRNTRYCYAWLDILEIPILNTREWVKVVVGELPLIFDVFFDLFVGLLKILMESIVIFAPQSLHFRLDDVLTKHSILLLEYLLIAVLLSFALHFWIAKQVMYRRFFDGIEVLTFRLLKCQEHLVMARNVSVSAFGWSLWWFDVSCNCSIFQNIHCLIDHRFGWIDIDDHDQFEVRIEILGQSHCESTLAERDLDLFVVFYFP